MGAELGRILGLWRGRGRWLVLGAAIAAVTALAGLALMVLAGRGVAQAALGTGAANHRNLSGRMAEA